MSHLKQYQGDVAADGRALGDEWADWDGKDEGHIRDGKSLFVSIAVAVVLAMDAASLLFVYLISPRLASWAAWLPTAAWAVAVVSIAASTAWLAQLLLTVASGRNLILHTKGAFFFFDFVCARAFRLTNLLGLSRDRVGHSFVRVSNAISRATKKAGRDERLLILLPRCLSKEELGQINGLKEKYPLEIHVVSGGELARKKVKELAPTAVIGVACERDLVSGIRDVGRRLSVIGIPNRRPEGPCRNTHIDMRELIEAIEFYVGPPKSTVS